MHLVLYAQKATIEEGCTGKTNWFRWEMKSTIKKNITNGRRGEAGSN